MSVAPLGCILAGGQSRRMGMEKAGLVVAGRPLIAHVAARLAPQCAGLIVAGRPDSDALRATGLAIVPDPMPEPGPLGGILAGLVVAAGRGHPQLLTAPVDTPLLPPDLGERLAAGQPPGAVACAASRGRAHHTVALWSTTLAPALDHALRVEGMRRVEAFLRRAGGIEVVWTGTPDPFTNLNTPADVARLEPYLAGS